jgi:hypothetical protein
MSFMDHLLEGCDRLQAILEEAQGRFDRAIRTANVSERSSEEAS